MGSLKKYCKLSANSILESVIALSIISVCLYIALLVYASVFRSDTSPKWYGAKNKTAELFFLLQVQDDSLYNNQDDKLIIEEERINTGLKQVTIKQKDSLGKTSQESYFIRTTNE